MCEEAELVIEKIVSLQALNDYEGIIEVFKECVDMKESESSRPLAKGVSNKRTSILSRLHLLSWPLPSEPHLKRIATFVTHHRIKRIYSIGCGTGLLEWLMQKYIDINDDGKDLKTQIIGVEIDSKWWISSYSPKHFIDLLYYGETFDPTSGFAEPLSQDAAMFCYFNNLPVFLEYLKSFRGTFVVIIGPISNEQFCMPGPRELADNVAELPTSEWKLLSCDQFGLISIDHIAIYERLCK